MKKIINIQLINFLLVKKLKSIVLICVTMIILPILVLVIVSLTKNFPKQFGIEILIFIIPMLFHTLISLPNIIINLRSSSLIKRMAASRISKTHYYSSLYITSMIFIMFLIMGSLATVYLVDIAFFKSISLNVIKEMFEIVENWGLFILNMFLFMSLLVITGIGAGMLFNSTALLIGTNLGLVGLILFMGGGILNFDVFVDFPEMYYFTPWSYNLWMIIKNMQGSTDALEQVYSTVVTVGSGMLITAIIYKFASFEGIR